ncbi:MAG: hypothetical protein Q4G28_02195 [Neisseria sp.]|nr:hypothetical protein [Neisseria sp.]
MEYFLIFRNVFLLEAERNRKDSSLASQVCYATSAQAHYWPE